MNYDDYNAKRAEQRAERKAVRDRQNAEIDEMRRLGKEANEARRNGAPAPEPEPAPEPVPVQEDPPVEEENFSIEPDDNSDGGQ